MNVSLAMTAALYGSTVVNHMQVTGLTKDASGKLNGARVKDVIPGKSGPEAEEFTVRKYGRARYQGDSGSQLWCPRHPSRILQSCRHGFD